MVPVLTNKSDLSQFDLQDGCVILMDKDSGWTSFDMVKKVRNYLRLKKAGHGGTLDPFATGLMLIGVSKGTKALHQLSGLSKRYRATICLGRSTDTYDRTGRFSGPATEPDVDEALVWETVSQMTGPQMQLPPMYSAKRVNGVRLYKLARKNMEVERQPQAIEIYEARILEFRLPYLVVDLHVSKGTYIRSFAHDLGQKLGVGAYLESLRRTAIEGYCVEDSFTIDAFMEAFKEWHESYTRT